MSSLLYKLLNPPVKALLRSPMHGLMSRNTLLLEFTGRRSGRALSTPISYCVNEHTAHCFTSRAFGWWRNLTTGATVSLTIQGQRWQSTPVVEHSDHVQMAAQLRAFLCAVPRDAAHAGVAMDKNGQPDANDIQRVVPAMVYLQFPLHKPEISPDISPEMTGH